MAQADIDKLLRLIARLRSPEGCPWDRKQTLHDVRAYLLEEAHEAAAAIDGADRQDLREEIGDLLFQAVFVARLAEEEGAFDLGDAIDAVHAKMIERHPHVFGGERLNDAAEVHRAWERRKASSTDTRTGAARRLLGGIPATLPALTAAQRISQKAAGVGFDWSGPAEVLDKVCEEAAEVAEVAGLRPSAGGWEQELPKPEAKGGDRRREEIGDLLFAVVNLARHLEVDAEAALATANRKFRRRFEAMEAGLAHRERSLADATPDEMEDAWAEAKRAERSSDPL